MSKSSEKMVVTSTNSRFEEIYSSSISTSEKIRSLHNEGMSRSDIVKFFNDKGYLSKNNHPMRYQMVRNILITPIKKEK